jgi:predicted enzyme related to lactoylglutathione lyase
MSVLNDWLCRARIWSVFLLVFDMNRKAYPSMQKLTSAPGDELTWKSLGRLAMGDEKKGCVLGVGGIFFRSKDPGRLGDWYAEHLGFEVEEWGDTRGSSFSPGNMPPASFTVWSAFAAGTEYFGNSGQSYMINLVVDDLDAALENVTEGGAEVLEEREEHDFGRFGWFVDPDGNRVELWEPPEPE